MELQRAVIEVEWADSIDHVEAALLSSFPSSAKDPLTVVGGIYLRVVELLSARAMGDVLEGYRDRHPAKQNARRSTTLILRDKAAMLDFPRIPSGPVHWRRVKAALQAHRRGREVRRARQDPRPSNRALCSPSSTRAKGGATAAH